MDSVTKDLLEALKYAASCLGTDGNDPIDLVIARAESALASPQPDADGWIPWAGGECPVAPNRIAQVKLRCGMTIKADEDLRWSYEDSLGDIIAYRVVEAQP